MEYSMYVCPECRRIFKVKGNDKTVRCNKCENSQLFDLHTKEESWRTYDAEMRDDIINSTIRQIEEKKTQDTEKVDIPKQESTPKNIEPPKDSRSTEGNGWGTNSFFSEDGSMSFQEEVVTKNTNTISLEATNAAEQQNSLPAVPTTNESAPKQRTRAARSPIDVYDEDKVLTIGEWLGSMFLLCIPIVRIVMFIIWISDSEKYGKNRKNWVIAKLIFTVTMLIVTFMLLKIIGTFVLAVLKAIIQSLF